MTTSELLTTPEVAAMLRMSPEALAQARHERRASPPYVRVGRRILYRRADVDHWLAAHRIEPQDAA